MTQPTDLQIAEAAGCKIRKGKVWGEKNYWYVTREVSDIFLTGQRFKTKKAAAEWIRDDLAMLRRIAGLDEFGNIPKDSTS